jgi:hypothetical protein
LLCRVHFRKFWVRKTLLPTGDPQNIWHKSFEAAWSLLYF